MKKKISIVIISVILAACMLFGIACQPISGGNNGSQPGGDSSSSTSGATGTVETSGSKELQILRSELKLTQEQVTSQIKAEYLIENNGYKDEDEVVVIISLDDKSLLESFNDEYSASYSSIADYVNSKAGAAQADKLIAKQNALITKLQNKGMIKDVAYRYTTVMNAVAVKMQYRYLDSVEGVKGVSSAMLSETYNRPQTIDSSNVSSIVNDVDVYPTGIFNSGSVNYTGKGTAVAILDSGFDIEHEVFTTMPNVANNKLLIKRNDVSAILSSTTAAKLTQRLDITDVYYNTKIPYMYDYADKDPDVKPYYSEHGTHVAGIIAGQSDTITGIAIDTQLVLMKVFPDLDDGGKTEDILAGLEDAVLLNVDAINMSLGSSCGFSREYDNDKLNAVYDEINKSGISLITAASNSYSSAFGGEQGNTNMVTNPDSGTVGSPSTFAAALSVASISGVKSKYLVADDKQVVFFNESNNIAGKANNFFDELYDSLNKNHNEIFNLDYVVVPGTGLRMNYSSIDVKGKIAVVRRGGNTFEEKALNAKLAGAVACIIYNNIDGDILMSMGKSDHIPTISISKDNGVALMEKGSGTITINYQNQAGPFMSDFSSWGPTPSLQLKPEITAHGGNILSAVPNGGYDELSGTSMASPNLCGIVVLIRQFLRDKYGDTKSWKEISTMTNQMLMSTATIVINEEANPYSPRKQGAGLASLKNVVNTDAYLTVDGNDRTKIELGDDPDMLGVYFLKFNVVNTSSKTLTYDMSVIGMTESVSTSDDKHVAEKAQLLNGDTIYGITGNGRLDGSTLTVEPNGTVKVTARYTLSYDDRELISRLFPYGMYVEGFVSLKQISNDENKVDLNVPFLGFYGDWTKAPMFDKTYYEVQKEKYDTSIEDEDKLQADYYATTPYGSYYYNYIIPLGTYLYDIDTTAYDSIPASEEHIALSNVLGTIDGINSVYAGLLRCAKEMHFTITDKVSGEVVWDYTDYNARKAYSLGSSPIPYYDYLHLSSLRLGLVNNRQYEFKMEGLLDYGDGGKDTNVRNSFSFDFYFDDEAPVLKGVTYEKEYDDNLKKDRYYINLTIYDNHYTQSVTPLIWNSARSYSVLTEHPIPVYSERNSDTVVRFEITSFLDDLFADKLITSALAFSIDDYALNSNVFICQLPGTRGDFKFTKDGDMEGSDLTILSMYEGEIVDITHYLATADETVDLNKDYLKHLVWNSSNTKVVEVQNGQVKCLAEGRATVTVQEQMELKQAVLIINVKPHPTDGYVKGDDVVDNVESSSIDELRFSYYETVFAYSRAAQTSKIGETGDRHFVSASNVISFYPGEKIKLFPVISPWYVEDKCQMEYSSTNQSVAIVDENGVVTGLKEGSTTISLRVNNSTLRARVAIEIKSEFVIENRTLIAYKGLGGNVVIPDDEGILYIGSYAFCLYDTDYSVELTEDDFDANKIPAANTTITSVEIPYGVEEIQKYAFYNCSGLKSVVIPETVKVIREYAFTGDKRLTSITLSGAAENSLNLANSKVETIGRAAFKNCTSLTNMDLSHIYGLGVSAFDGCTALSNIVDLKSLRNTGARAFQNCTALETVTFGPHTQLSYGMFAKSGLTGVEILNSNTVIPTFAFVQCANLETVVIKNNIESIGLGAFMECPKLKTVTIEGTVNSIDEQAFYKDVALEEFVLPNNELTVGNNAFNGCTALSKITFQANTKLLQTGVTVVKDELSSTENFVSANVNGHAFSGTKLETFVVDPANENYSVSSDNLLLLSKDGSTVILAASSHDFGDYSLPSTITKIGEGAFAGVKIKSVTITSENVEIGDYAFAATHGLETVNLPSNKGIVIGNYAFTECDNEDFVVNNLDKAIKIGRYAFSLSSVAQVAIGDEAVVGEGAFFRSSITQATIGANARFGLGAFQRCTLLATVNMPAEGGVYFGPSCFAYDTSLATIDLSKVGTADKHENIPQQCFYGCTHLARAEMTYVDAIGDYAFSECSALLAVTVPSVKSIGVGAFCRYEQYGGAPIFTAIVLPDALTYLGDGAFLGCGQLKEIAIPSSINAVPDFAFSYCAKLTKVTLPDSLTKIGMYSFAGCAMLSDIDLSNVETIDDYAFTSCVVLENIDLSYVKTIGIGAFAETYVGGDIVANNLISIGANAFQKSGATVYSSIVSFTAAMLQDIGQQAFDGNYKMKEFVLSWTISNVGMGAFNGCSGLESFYYLIGSTKLSNGEVNDYATLHDGVLYTMLPSGHYQLTSVPGGMNNTLLEVAEGTVRIDSYAGNSNKNITYIILPDSLRIIGNYAFYGYSKLQTVEFRSVVAPALEDSYNYNSSLSETDPGYNDLHNQFNVIPYELYYYTFIDLVGKNKPINMILPANEKLVGYDSLVYQVYFGKVANANRSEYVAMENSLVNFLRYVEEINKITTLKQDHETLINNALSAYNSVTQNPADYGISDADYQQMVNKVKQYKSQMIALKIANSTKQTRDVQAMLDNLPETFSIANLTELQRVNAAMAQLKIEERALLDLTHYNELVNAYNEYCQALKTEIAPIVNNVSGKNIAAQAVAAVLMAAAAVVAVGKRFC